MEILALDLSKRSCGWAVWADSWSKPRYGHWVLGSEITLPGQTFAKLHVRLGELYSVMPFEYIYAEEPIHHAQLQGHTNLMTLHTMSGLAAHAQSFAHAYGLPQCQFVNVETWRPDFIGRDVFGDTKAVARRATKRTGKKHSARDKLKALTVARCQQLGFEPRRDDEADAIGILDYACYLRGVVPPWRREEVLRPPLEQVG